MTDTHTNGRLAQCIEYQSRSREQIETLMKEFYSMKKRNEAQDRAIGDLRVTLARWGGAILVLTTAASILGPVIARTLTR